MSEIQNEFIPYHLVQRRLLLVSLWKLNVNIEVLKLTQMIYNNIT